MKKAAPEGTSPKKTLLFLTAIAGIGLAIYAGSLDCPFVWDDTHFVTNNVSIRDWRNLPDIFFKNPVITADGKNAFYRPLQMFSHMVEYSLWGLDVRGYHLVSVLFHILTAFCVFWLARIVFRDDLLAAFTGAIFVSHPVQTEAVTYISGRADPLGAVFLLLALILYIKNLRAKNAGLFFLMIVSYAAALFSKTQFLILPALVVLYHFTVRGRLDRRALLWVALVSLGYVALRMTATQAAGLLWNDIPAIARRIPGAFAAVTTYLRLMAAPFGLHVDYGQKVFSFSEPSVLAGIAAAVLLIAYALKTRKRDPLVFFSIFWFFISLIPVLNIYPIAFYMAEHYLYLPLIGFSLLTAKALAILWRSGSRRFPAAAALAGLIGFYSFATIDQNSYWRDPETLFKRAMAHNPRSIYAMNNLAIIYGERGELEKTVALCLRSIEADPRQDHAYVNLAKAYSLLGRKDEAISTYKRAIKIMPDRVIPYCNLASVYESIGRDNDAVEYYKKAIEVNPKFLHAHFFLGNVYRKLNMTNEAVASYREAVKIDPKFWEAYNQMGLLYLAAGNEHEALAMFEQAIAVKPDAWQPYAGIAKIHERRGEIDLARGYFDKARRLGREDLQR
ncbi:tetratricopeptide repeat protein [Candidatus Omnitrophota bacterium]